MNTNIPDLRVIEGGKSTDTDTAEVPAHDLDAEAAVLSAVLLDPSALPRVLDFLLPEHFFSEAHRRIYEAALQLRAEGRAVDEQTVASRLKEQQRLAQVGGMPYIAEVLGCSPDVSHVRDHAMTVFERWRLRQVLFLCDRAKTHGRRVVDVQAFSDNVVKSIAEIARRRAGEKLEDNFAVLSRRVRMLAEVEQGAPATNNGKGPALPTGIWAYDHHAHGLYAGQVTCIVALPGVGKTALALQIAVNVARLGVAVAFFSTEMSRDEICDRQIQRFSRIDGRRLQLARQKPTLSAEEMQRLRSGLLEQQALRLHVFDDSAPTVDDICARSKELHERSLAVDGVPLGLIVVDYVQRLAPSPLTQNKKKYEQVAHASQRLVTLARELKLPVLELAQQKNPDPRNKNKKPELGDVAECFQVARDAHNVAYLYRPSTRDGRNLKLMIAKQRNGEEAEEHIVFEREYSTFIPAPPGGPRTPVSRQYVEDGEDD